MQSTIFSLKIHFSDTACYIRLPGHILWKEISRVLCFRKVHASFLVSLTGLGNLYRNGWMDMVRLLGKPSVLEGTLASSSYWPLLISLESVNPSYSQILFSKKQEA